MPLIAANNVVKSFGDMGVLAGVSCALEPGEKVGLVGRNGAGKTTLLRIMARLDIPEEGSVSLRPGATVGYLSQIPAIDEGYTLWDEAAAAFAGLRTIERRLAEAEAALAAPEIHGDEHRLSLALEDYGRLRDRFERGGGFTYEAEIRRALSGLGFQEGQWSQPLGSMSGGQQSRAALARLLLSAPDLLLLDEPTNHLDLDALEWLQEFLGGYRGALLLVSHDRYLLDAVTVRTLELEDGHLDEYPGNYSFYVGERAARHERQQEAFERQREEIDALKAYIRRYRAGQKSRQAKSREKRLARIEPIEAPRTVRTLAFRLETSRRGPQTILRFRNVTKRFGDREVFRRVTLEIRRGERVGLIGSNGAGKTTLLRILAGLEPPTSGVVEIGPGVKIGYFAQQAEETLDLGRSVLDEVLGSRRLSPEQVRTVLGRFLFSGDAVFKTVGQLSGGERRRVALAKMVLDRPDLLLLDEPTTHLDLSSLEVLEAALAAFSGTIVLVSHDRYLLDHLATRLLVLEEGEMKEVQGPYHRYRETVARTQIATPGRAPTSGQPAATGRAAEPVRAAESIRTATPGRAAASSHAAAPNRGTESNSTTSQPRPHSSRRLAKRSPDIPTADDIAAQIGALEQEQRDLSRLMGDPELYRDADRARTTVRRYEEVGTALQRLYEALVSTEGQSDA
jgi:ATP-binding cassette, subfamily F, member 3